MIPKSKQALLTPRFKRYLCFCFLALTGCDRAQQFEFTITEPPASWSHVSDYHPCYLKIDRKWRSSFRVNCFQINGELYTHSSRLVAVHETLTSLFHLGGSWVSVVERNPRIQLSIDFTVHEMLLVPVDHHAERDRILKARGYGPIPHSIRVYLIKPG
jgi:hypothetical protein